MDARRIGHMVKRESVMGTDLLPYLLVVVGALAVLGLAAWIADHL